MISSSVKTPTVTDDERKKYRALLEDIIGTKGAYLVDGSLTILCKVPLTELASTVKTIGSGVHAIVIDGPADANVIRVAEQSSVPHVVAVSITARSPRVLALGVAELTAVPVKAEPAKTETVEE